MYFLKEVILLLQISTLHLHLQLFLSLLLLVLELRKYGFMQHWKKLSSFWIAVATIFYCSAYRIYGTVYTTSSFNLKASWKYDGRAYSPSYFYNIYFLVLTPNLDHLLDLLWLLFLLRLH